QVHLRGHRLDFDAWAALGNAGWGYEDVLPYFKRTENNERGQDTFRGTGGPLNIADQPNPNPLTVAFVQGATALGLHRNEDLNGRELDGVGFCQFTQKDGQRHSGAAAYLTPVLQRRNLELVTEAHATRVLFDGRRAAGIEFERNHERLEARATREVILCGGAI